MIKSRKLSCIDISLNNSQPFMRVICKNVERIDARREITNLSNDCTSSVTLVYRWYRQERPGSAVTSKGIFCEIRGIDISYLDKRRFRYFKNIKSYTVVSCSTWNQTYRDKRCIRKAKCIWWKRVYLPGGSIWRCHRWSSPICHTCMMCFLR